MCVCFALGGKQDNGGFVTRAAVDINLQPRAIGQTQMGNPELWKKLVEPITTLRVDDEIILRWPTLVDTEELFALLEENRVYLSR